MENELRRAIDENSLELHYQPIFDVDGGKLEGFEALVRWRHPERGMIMPDRFIPLAEESRADRAPGAVGAQRGLQAAQKLG